jgi:hypothetical protein
MYSPVISLARVEIFRNSGARRVFEAEQKWATKLVIDARIGKTVCWPMDVWQTFRSPGDRRAAWTRVAQKIVAWVVQIQGLFPIRRRDCSVAEDRSSQ